MKKIISILLASVLLVCAFCVNVSAVTVYTVTLEAPETIEVDPGQTYVPLTWNMTQNQGWSAFKFFVEFDGDVFSFASGEEAYDIEEPDGGYGFFLTDSRKYMKNIGSIDPNIFGFQQGVDPQITKDKSSFLVVAKDAGANSTATGDFFTVFLNIAEDAPAGEYEIKITTDPNNCSAVEGPSVAVPSITWGTAKVVVKGEAGPDDRLGVVGAQLRIADANKGITSGFRFVNSITVDLYNTLAEANALPKKSSDTGVGFGSVVLPTASIPAGETLTKETAGAVVVPAVKLYQAPKEGDTEYMFTACLVGYQETAAIYQRNLTVVPYVTYMDGENEVTIYGESYSTNIFEVAKVAVASGNETESISEHLNNTILHVVDPVTYPKQSWTGIYRP